MGTSISSSPRRVLIVDDNRDAAQALAAVLTAHDHLVRQAYDGLSALTEAHEFDPDVVFLDLLMPGMDGFAVAQRLRDEEHMRSKRMLIVALSAHSDQAFLEATAESGFDTHLHKPASSVDLLGILDRV